MRAPKALDRPNISKIKAYEFMRFDLFVSPND